MTPEANQAREAVRQRVKELADRLDEIRALCLRYNHSGANPGTHALANKVLQLADAETKREFK